ncbi:hypothetical protein F2P56_000074 [Juglans regia]|uniref:Uncharacterized protein LOC109001286 n=2 Tax=Juglans regia TaxID=51240 RepID=A0A2I4FQW7_JUGRE|nr:uncharacterized protein LOC109001286 [Juglans regia]XP_018834048.1 uncharacterized protein LOC109001286 [Juglans regia]KAF5479236.1 hypothetical protein F2P56_000074 [Juglans regia]
MAADQRRKRLLGASIRGSSSRQKHRLKRTDLGLPQNGSNMQSHISLEWDGNQKRVVAKREQIGISWRDVKTFSNSVLCHQNTLADVFPIPQEILKLENLTEVLSYEVWQSHLSENERNFLVGLLPRGSEPQQVVQALLAGDNFHFGNPFLKWGASLCSGSLHPDAVLHREHCLKAEKKTYYLKLQKYHNDMIGYLLKLKERCESCKDPEKEIVQKIWKSIDGLEKRIPSHGNESIFPDPEDDFTATSESCSGAADDKVCSSDNQNSSLMKHAELLKRVSEKGFTKDEGKNLWIASDDVLNLGAKAGIGDKLHGHNIHSSDGAKYMSYFKISKKQHELVKNMKQSGKSIQSSSLNRVLGNIDSFHVQPYEVFVEEEQKKLHQHWLQLATKVLPVAIADWREKWFRRWLMANSLEQEMKDKLKPLMQDDDNKNLENMLQDQKENKLINNVSTVEDDEESVLGSPRNQESVPGSPHNHESVPVSPWSQESVPVLPRDQESVPVSPQNQSPQQIYSLSCGHEVDTMAMESENNHIMPKSDTGPRDETEYSGNLNTADIVTSQGASLTSGKNVWPSVSMPQSYNDSTASHEFTVAALEHSRVNDLQRAHSIDLESDLHVEETGKDFLHRQSGECSFSSYPSQDQNELLQSLFKSQGIVSYHQEQKQKGLAFQPPNNLTMENGQFPGNFQEQPQQSLPLEQDQKRQNGVYMQRNGSGNMYSDGVRYSIPRQEHMAPVTLQDWTVNSISMPAPLQSGLNGEELLSQNWYSGEHQVHGGWTGSDGVSFQSQSIGSGSGADQSIIDVITHCNQLRPTGPYDSVGSTEQFTALRNYGIVGGVTPRINNVLPQASHPLDYLSGREAGISMIPDDMGWMNLPHQSSVLHDPMGKPYLRSWNN